MNWFERYGIVGAYFLIIFSFWVNSFSSFFTFEPEKWKLLGIVFASTFLPVGYILTVCSQWFYYTMLGGRHIHREISTILSQSAQLNKYDRRQLRLDQNIDEAICEAIATSFLRLGRIRNINAEGLRLLMPFCTRRFDVISINNGIILSSILSLPTAFALIIYFPNISLTINFDLLSLFLLSLGSIVLILILMGLSRILGNQIIEINRSLFGIEQGRQDMRLLDRLRERLMRDAIPAFHGCLIIVILASLLIVSILRISSLR